ncbi:MAG: hypothetical protein R2861_08400 [Desulfobacterales bacterium]
MYGQEFLTWHVGESIIRKLRDALYDKIIDLPISFFIRSAPACSCPGLPMM